MKARPSAFRYDLDLRIVASCAADIYAACLPAGLLAWIALCPGPSAPYRIAAALIAGCLVVAALRAMRAGRAPFVSGLTLTRAGVWSLRDEAGGMQRAALLNGTRVGAACIVLAFRRDDGARRFALILPGTVDRVAYRRLSVRLRFDPLLTGRGSRAGQPR